MTVSKKDQSLLEGFYAALAAGEVDAIGAALTDDFVGRFTPGLPFGIGGEHRGAADTISEGWFAIGKHWRVRAEPASYTLLADGRVQVEGTYRGSGRASGTPFEAGFVHQWDLREGRISGLTQLTDSAAFVAALGGATPQLETIDLTIADGVATVQIARAEVRNAINQQLADDLLAAAVQITGDASVRAVLICGDGTDLTVGGDITYFTDAEQGASDDLGLTLRQMVTPFHLAFQTLAELDAPIITVAQGSVAGGGLGLVFAADVVVAASDAKFVTAFAALGLSGDGGGTWHLPRRIGPARAAWAYLTNEPITARQGLDWGLVTEVVPVEDARARGEELARRLAAGPTQAFAQMRALLRQSWDRSFPEQLHAEIEALTLTGRSADASAAIKAFLTRQRPTFRGE